MGNIATGIGLSGKLETDNSGQRDRLDVAKVQAQQRLAEQGERRKERDALESEVRKNMFIKNDLNMPFYQRDWANRSAATLTDIVEGVSTGDMTKAQAYGKMHEFNNYANSIKKADEQLYNSFEEVRKNPMKYDWSGSRMFGGKEVNSIFEALDDPYANTPEGMQELAANFGGTEYQFKQSKPEEVAMGMPERVVNFMPTPMTDPLDASLALAKDKALYTELREGKAESFDPRTRKLMKEYGYGMNEDGVGMIRDEVLGNASVMRSYEKRLREEYKKQNPGAIDADFMKTDWMSQVPQLYEAEIASSLRNRLEGRSLKEATIPEPKEEKATLSDYKKVFTVATTPAYISAEDEKGLKTGYNVIPYTARPSKTLSKVNVDLPAGHYEIMSGKIKKVDSPNSLPAIPKGPAWLDGKLGFMYTNDSETYFNPLDQGSYQMWIQHTGVPEEDVIKQITLVGGGSKQAESQAKAWMEKMGLQGTTPAGQSGAGTIKLQDLPVGAKIEVRNGENYYNGKKVEI